MGAEGQEEGVGDGGMAPSLTSIFIYHRFPGRKASTAENRPGAGSAVHTSTALASQTLPLTMSVPVALGKSTLKLLRTRVLK